MYYFLLLAVIGPILIGPGASNLLSREASAFVDSQLAFYITTVTIDFRWLLQLG